MTKVIDFNKFKTERETQKFDELVEEAEAIDEFSADFAFSVVMDISEALHELDYDVMDDPKCILELLSIVEAIRGLIYRIDGSDYAYHKVSESMFGPFFENKSDYKKALMSLFEIYSE